MHYTKLIPILLFAMYSCSSFSSKTENTENTVSKPSSELSNINPTKSDTEMEIKIQTKTLPDSILSMWRGMQLKPGEENRELNDDEIDIRHNKRVLLGAKVIESCLVKKGFKPLDAQEYRNKVRAIFNIDPYAETDTYCTVKYDDYVVYYVDGNSDICEFSMRGSEYDTEIRNLYFLRNLHFIGYYYQITTWIRMRVDLSQATIKIDASLFHINRFLFNDSNASLTWLMNNKPEFLDQLVKIFGYSDNDRVNEFVLRRSYESVLEGDKVVIGFSYLGNLFIKKSCAGGIEIREKLLNYICLHTSTNNSGFLEMLSKYSYSLGVNQKDWLIEKGRYSREDLEKALTYMGYYIEKTYQNNPSLARSIDDNCFQEDLATNENLREVLKKNNYYDLEGFEELFKKELEVR